MELTTSRHVLKLSLHVSFSQILLGSSGKKTILYELPVTKPTEHLRHLSDDFKEVWHVKSIYEVFIIFKSVSIIIKQLGNSYTSSYFLYEGVLMRKFQLGGKLGTDGEILLSMGQTQDGGSLATVGSHQDAGEGPQVTVNFVWDIFEEQFFF